ncbi:MAG TPA: YfiR family protein [Dissulfurispiraceae bacterium]|nr:YfiR family protein [Dissulfurispiraceae bacterium]
MRTDVSGYGKLRLLIPAVLITALCGVLLVMLRSAPAQGGETITDEYRIKAAFLYNFAKFVEWPAGAFKDSRSPLVICILGRDPFGAALDEIRDKTVGGRAIVLKHIKDAGEAENCHILFISESERESVAQHVARGVRNRAILSVGDTRGYAQKGVVINMIIVNSKVGFEINIDAAQRAGLMIHSQLLKLAKIIKEKA